MAIGDVVDQCGDPTIIIFQQIQFTQGIFLMCIEAGRNQDKLGLKGIEGREKSARYDFETSVHLSCIDGCENQMLARSVEVPVGIKRMLKG